MVLDNEFFKNELREAWQEEKDYSTVEQFCSDYNISVNYFYKHIGSKNKVKTKSLKYGQKIVPKIPPRDLSQEEINLLIKEYKQGASEEKLSDKYNINLNQIFDVLESTWEDMQLERNLMSSNNCYEKSIMELYLLDGLTCKEIGYMFSIPAYKVAKGLKDAMRFKN